MAPTSGYDSVTRVRRLWRRRLTMAILAGVQAVIAGAVLSAGSASANSAPTCPNTAPQGTQTNPWPPAERRLAPRGARTINLCRYSGMNTQPNFRLVGSHLVSRRATIRRLVHRLDALKSAPPNQAFACPADDGSQVVATLLYPAQRQVQISVTLSGCETATNGDVTRAAFNFDGRNPQGPKVVGELKRLTR